MCQGIPGQIVELIDDDLATVKIGGVRRAVNIAPIVLAVGIVVGIIGVLGAIGTGVGILPSFAKSVRR